MESFTARAPGKVILLGEHAVVYGQPALALPLDRGVTVTCTPASKLELIDPPPTGAEALLEALGEVATALKTTAGVRITSELPLGAGLGSSAAVAVAATRALASLAGRTLSEDEVLAFAEGMERSFHGRPSGVDHTTCLVARPLRFQRGTPNQVTPIQVGSFALVISHAGARATNTRERVLALRDRHEREPQSLEPLFSEVGALVEQAQGAVLHGRLAELGSAMNRNQEILAELGMSTARIDVICARMRELGARGAKLTGAGGGGAVIAVHPDPEALAESLTDWGAPSFVARWKE
jgi:mevalonate kinase